MRRDELHAAREALLADYGQYHRFAPVVVIEFVAGFTGGLRVKWPKSLFGSRLDREIDRFALGLAGV